MNVSVDDDFFLDLGATRCWSQMVSELRHDPASHPSPDRCLRAPDDQEAASALDIAVRRNRRRAPSWPPATVRPALLTPAQPGRLRLLRFAAPRFGGRGGAGARRRSSLRSAAAAGSRIVSMVAGTW